MSKQRDWIQWPDPEFVGMLLFIVGIFYLVIGSIFGAMFLSYLLTGEPR